MSAMSDDQTPTREGLRAFAALDVARAVGMNRAEVRAWRTVGRARLAAGKAQAANDVLEYACFLAPDDAEAWELLGAARLALRRPGDAWSAIAAALVLEPTWKRAVLAKLCADADGRQEASERWREAAWRLAPEDEEARAALARAAGPEDGGAA
ncbi:MAG: hypothetical protein HY907_22850 [Deltaproteobacteria bacterium]|nr:hypothetical protein [Deltaproteobacteria bacterium]